MTDHVRHDEDGVVINVLVARWPDGVSCWRMTGQSFLWFYFEQLMDRSRRVLSYARVTTNLDMVGVEDDWALPYQVWLWSQLGLTLDPEFEVVNRNSGGLVRESEPVPGCLDLPTDEVEAHLLLGTMPYLLPFDQLREWVAQRWPGKTAP